MSFGVIPALPTPLSSQDLVDTGALRDLGVMLYRDVVAYPGERGVFIALGQE